MAEVIFNYNGNNTKIQCDIDSKMMNIIEKFLSKIEKKEDIYYYLYNGNNINKELTFNEQANEYDKNRKIMNIIVYYNNENNSKKNEIFSKKIICPLCKESTMINFKDFKINLFGCNNNHNIKDILINEFEETQKIDISKIQCDICKINNKNTTTNNDFYICNTCGKNICPLCKTIHDNNHKIINYNDKDYICKKHNETFNKYCKMCKEDLCILCENEHKGHDSVHYKDILLDKNKILETFEELKNYIIKFKCKVNIIQEIFNRTIFILDTYYQVNYNILNNYNINKRNYLIFIILEVKNILEKIKMN